MNPFQNQKPTPRSVAGPYRTMLMSILTEEDSDAIQDMMNEMYERGYDFMQAVTTAGDGTFAVYQALLIFKKRQSRAQEPI